MVAVYLDSAKHLTRYLILTWQPNSRPTELKVRVLIDKILVSDHKAHMIAIRCNKQNQNMLLNIILDFIVFDVFIQFAFSQVTLLITCIQNKYMYSVQPQ